LVPAANHKLVVCAAFFRSDVDAPRSELFVTVTPIELEDLNMTDKPIPRRSTPASKRPKERKEKKPVVPAPMGAEWLTIPQTALHFNVSERTIWRWIDDDEFAYVVFPNDDRASSSGSETFFRHRKLSTHTPQKSLRLAVGRYRPAYR
jgi:hypothetical protein